VEYCNNVLEMLVNMFAKFNQKLIKNYKIIAEESYITGEVFYCSTTPSIVVGIKLIA
jgi:hypothetical protein